MKGENNSDPKKNQPLEKETEYEQNGKYFTENEEVKSGKNMLHQGRPLSEMELEELRIHKENNEFLGISDVPEAGNGAGNVSGMAPDKEDLDMKADELKDNEMRDSNFGRNYKGGIQSEDHYIETYRNEKKKEDEK